MEDILVSYPVAKLAKKKGFSGLVHHYYGTEDWEQGCYFIPYSQNEYMLKSEVAAPTQSLLQRWLRETHQLHVQVSPKQGHLLEWYVYVIDGKQVVEEVKALFFTEYEEALMRGLELALNLLPD